MKRILHDLKKASVEVLSKNYRAMVRKKKLPLLHLGEAEFNELADQHADSLNLWGSQLDRVLAQAAEERELFGARSLEDLTFQGRRMIRSLWESVLDYTLALDQVKVFHEHFPALSPVRKLERHSRSFSLSFAAFAVQFHNGLKLIRLTQDSLAVQQLLDEEAPELGIPARCFDRLKWNVLHIVDVAKLVAGDAYARTLSPVIRKSRGGPELLERIDRATGDSRSILKEKGVKYFADNGVAILKGKVFRAWFPLQKGIAAWMGETRTKKNIRRLIRPAQLRELRKRLEPGDILVERRNGHLSNVGLPGFWPHAALYIGTPDQVKAEFPELVRRLRLKHRTEWRKYLRTHGDGNAVSVIEATGPGVHFNSLESSASADYVGMMRPYLPPADKAVAIERAFHYLGRPYDFNFDFLTDAELVCSELVYKCYQPGRDTRGVPFKLEEVAGRPVLPPNIMVAQYDHWTRGHEPPLHFVAFLDGRVKKGDAIFRPEPNFRASHARPKWDLAQP